MRIEGKHRIIRMRSGAAVPNPSRSAAAHGGLTATGQRESKWKMPFQFLKRYSEEMPAGQVDRLLSENGRVAAPAYEFRMPLHYPRYSKFDYEKMPEWQLDCLLADYGLPVAGDVHQKRNFAMGAFLWPH